MPGGAEWGGGARPAKSDVTERLNGGRVAGPRPGGSPAEVSNAGGKMHCELVRLQSNALRSFAESV